MKGAGLGTGSPTGTAEKEKVEEDKDLPEPNGGCRLKQNSGKSLLTKVTFGHRSEGSGMALKT